MKSDKSKITPRWVTNGQLRFAGRIFTHPVIAEATGRTIYVAYETFVDDSIDIVTADRTILVTLPNRPMSVVDEVEMEA